MRNWIIGNFVTGNSNIQLELQNIENLGQYRLENRLFWVSGGIPVTSGNLYPLVLYVFDITNVYRNGMV